MLEELAATKTHAHAAVAVHRRYSRGIGDVQRLEIAAERAAIRNLGERAKGLRRGIHVYEEVACDLHLGLRYGN